MRKVFVLVPSLVPTGPIKGAIALCNSFAARCGVTLVAHKASSAESGGVDPRVGVLRLAELGGWWAKVRHYRRLLAEAGPRAQVASLSLGLSADVVNVFARRYAVTFASIRGHLHRTYRVDFGPRGLLIAVLHYLTMTRLDHVVAMTGRMARQFAQITWKRPHVVGNFIDEARLESFRAGSGVDSTTLHFVFVGRLSPLKRPELVIEAVCRLAGQGISCSLDVFGDGPLRAALRADVTARGAGELVRFHGHVDNPWALAAGAHCLVLPSLTEGISRAVLEGLYLGVPCVLRDVDSNAEVVSPGVNGALFSRDDDLAAAMQVAADLGRQAGVPRPVLLTEQFRQRPCAERYFQLLQTS